MATIGSAAASNPGVQQAVSQSLPQQMHHFATTINEVYTPRMQEIAGKYGLDLQGAWNKQLLPHLGRHPNEYHEFVLRNMRQAERLAGSSQGAFLESFDVLVKQPVIQNPELLRKAGWP
ncbi:MAG: AHH domain-containing protein [Planctomycetes bacterium]|nr:AHH domain-containing protein [Planctomycetota bacterium]